ncbi:citrate lyase acyl carrier protein [Enterococcus sp. 8G7_MSG3316]|uniref:Citrate lyase acyl carrier protein n=1 Tax=Candidatus Enterococcus testudinis TaxID=1834191 RepID=A0A242A910_9ENTE|nr:citrate lyase acyl carrier protein [Enterococcus sp. 8G7_MSG3316]OTN77518.1 citrate lyase acyl carrier protein [Enterococcus sp. 8G7_MSG3316]
MEIKKSAVAGSVESSDILIAIEPITEQEIKLSLDSSVEKQYGNQIRKVILDTLAQLKVNGVQVTATDKGALDCTIKARTLTAVHRAAEQERYAWKEIDSWND